MNLKLLKLLGFKPLFNDRKFKSYEEAWMAIYEAYPGEREEFYDHNFYVHPYKNKNSYQLTAYQRSTCYEALQSNFT